MERYKFLVRSYVCKINDLEIICLKGTGRKTCQKKDCDGSITKTVFKLRKQWNCNGKLTTITIVTEKNGRTKRIVNSSNCYGSQCQIPKCPERKICECQGGKKSSCYCLLTLFHIQLSSQVTITTRGDRKCPLWR